MCLGRGPQAPTPPPKIPEAARAPQVPTKREGVGGATDDARRRAATGEGRSTILTGSRGVQGGGTIAQKTLLGL